MFRFGEQTPFLGAIAKHIATRTSDDLLSQAHLADAARLLAEAERSSGVAFLDIVPPAVQLTNLTDDFIQSRINAFLTATHMILDAEMLEASGCEPVFDGAWEDDFLTNRAWGAFVANWMNVTYPIGEERWHYMHFYVTGFTEDVIANYIEYADAFILALRLKNDLRHADPGAGAAQQRVAADGPGGCAPGDRS